MSGLNEKRWEEMSKLEMPLSQVIEDYTSELRILRRSPKTINFYLRNLRMFLKWLKRHGYQGVLEDISLSTVKRYILYLEEDHRKYQDHPYMPQRDECLSPYSIQGHVRTLKALSSWLYREEYLNESVLSRLKLPKAPKLIIKVLTDEEVTKIAREQGFDGFVNTFFSELEGNELIKRALSCALLSTPDEPVHVLVMGDPAGGKTLAKDIITRKLGAEIELVGANTTRSGLVCNLATGEPGVLTYSNGKVVLVDEFDKIPDQDVEYCLELLSNGKCSVHSARIHETIESHFIMIAFANPVATVFTTEPINEIRLPPILLSRFALIVKAEELDADRRKVLLKRKLLDETSAPEQTKWHLLWLREARKHYPKIIASAEEINRYIDKVDNLIEQYVKTPLRRDMRMGDYAKRVPMAMARASFSDVDGQILDEGVQLIEDCIAAW